MTDIRLHTAIYSSEGERQGMVYVEHDGDDHHLLIEAPYLDGSGIETIASVCLNDDEVALLIGWLARREGVAA